MIIAVLLAGSNKQDTFLVEQGVASKAELNIAGKPLVQYALEALAKAEQIDKVIYVGQSIKSIEDLYDEFAESTNDITTNMQNAFRAALAYSPDSIVVVSGDLVWLTPEAIDTFVLSSSYTYPEASLVYPIITRKMVELWFNQPHRRYAKLNGEELTGGSVLFLRPNCVEPLLVYADKAYKARKNLLALTRLLGFGIMIGFLLRRLTVAQVEARISKGLGLQVRALRVALPVLALDVDEAEDLRCAERDMGRKRHASQKK